MIQMTDGVAHAPSRRTAIDRNHGKYMIVLYTKPADCGGRCVYCIRTRGLTRSTLANEDTLMARDQSWSSAGQLLQRVSYGGLQLGSGHKFELRIKGNSFTNYDPEYLERFIAEAYDQLNGHRSSSFGQAFAGQIAGTDRCVQIVVETRPDQIDEDWCRMLARWGVTTVEIGVQSLSDEVLNANRRGHGVDAVVRASRLIREFGFELGYQVMVGLPAASREYDADMLTRQLWTEEFYPDTLKIYPCVATHVEKAQTGLYRMLRNGGWHPFTDDEYARFLDDVVPSFPRDVHVNRVQRIMAEDDIRFGPRRPIDRVAHATKSVCMWQRSIQQRGVDPLGDFTNYSVARLQHGNEVCLQAVMPDDTLLGYARVSLRGREAHLRDLRVLGVPLRVGERNPSGRGTQHMGIGRALLREAELACQQEGSEALLVASSAGALQYFIREGYRKGRYPHQLTKLIRQEPGRCWA